MKQIILLMMLLASVCLQAKQTVLTTYFSVECEAQWGTDTIMIEDDNTITYTITLQNALGVYVRWNAYGDIVLTNQTATSATFYSKGPAKGRISYIYDPASDDPCQFTRNAFIDIYKHFDAKTKYGITIVGPDCIEDGDSVVYSIKPILTSSVNSGIGIDTYNWNVFTPAANYVQNVSYISGDSSSVTFKAGTMTGNDSITVRVGLANEEYRLVKYLGKAAPMPVVNDTCLPYNQSSFEVDVYNEDYPNLHYNWTYPANWRIYYIEDAYNSRVRLTTTEEGDEATFTVTSSFTGQETECSYASQASFTLHRSWATTAQITPSNPIVANNCDFIEFELRDAHLGDRSNPKWEKPTTWEVEGEEDHTIFKARPVNSTNYVDTIKVWEYVCNHKDSCVAYVYIRPAKVTAITDHGCLTVGEEYTFTVERLEVGPTPTGYIWLRGADTLQNSASNSVTFTADVAYPTLTVISKGEYNLLSERATFNLSYNPVPPAGILDTNSCVNFNMPDTLTFSILNPTPNQKYAWTEPTGWTKIDSTNNNTSVTMISNGVAGTHTIYAKGVNEDNSECSESSSVSHNVTINAIVPIVMRIPGGSTTAYYFIIGEGTPLLTEWNIYDNNGTLVEQYSLANSGALTVNDNSVIYNDVNNSTQYTLVLYVTLTNSCKYRYVCGAQSNSNPAPSRRSNNIYKTDNRLNVKIFPNPVQSEISINIFDTDNYIADISIYDMNGSLVSQSLDFNTEEKFDVSVLPMGNYIIYIKQGEKYCANLFIKQ